MRIDSNSAAANANIQMNAMRSLSRATTPAQTGPMAANANVSEVGLPPVLDVVGSTQPAETAAAPAAPSPLQALLDAWGQSDSTYDYNTDGTVDGLDLAMFLAGSSQSAPAGGSQATTIDPSPGGSSPHPAVKALLDAWGRGDSQYDLDGDGAVDGRDLAHLLSALTPTPSEPPTPTQGAGGDMLQALLSAWGQAQSQFDFNNDGVVDGIDLATLLASPSTQSPTGTAPVAVPDEVDSAAASSPAIKPLTVSATHDNASGAAPEPQLQSSNPGVVSGNEVPPLLIAEAQRTIATYGLAQKLLSRVSFESTPTNDANPAATAPHNDAPSASMRAQRHEAALALTQAATAIGEEEDQPLLGLRKAIDGMNFGANERGLLLRRFMAEFPKGLGIEKIG